MAVNVEFFEQKSTFVRVDSAGVLAGMYRKRARFAIDAQLTPRFRAIADSPTPYFDSS